MSTPKFDFFPRNILRQQRAAGPRPLYGWGAVAGRRCPLSICISCRSRLQHLERSCGSCVSCLRLCLLPICVCCVSVVRAIYMIAGSMEQYILYRGFCGYLFNIYSVFLGCFYSTQCTKNRGFDGFILVKITIKLTVWPEIWTETTKIIIYFRAVIWYNIDSWKGYRSYQPGPWKMDHAEGRP